MSRMSLQLLNFSHNCPDKCTRRDKQFDFSRPTYFKAARGNRLPPNKQIQTQRRLAKRYPVGIMQIFLRAPSGPEEDAPKAWALLEMQVNWRIIAIATFWTFHLCYPTFRGARFCAKQSDNGEKRLLENKEIFRWVALLTISWNRRCCWFWSKCWYSKS